MRRVIWLMSGMLLWQAWLLWQLHRDARAWQQATTQSVEARFKTELSEALALQLNANLKHMVLQLNDNFNQNADFQREVVRRMDDWEDVLAEKNTTAIKVVRLQRLVVKLAGSVAKLRSAQTSTKTDSPAP